MHHKKSNQQDTGGKTLMLPSNAGQRVNNSAALPPYYLDYLGLAGNKLN